MQPCPAPTVSASTEGPDPPTSAASTERPAPTAPATLEVATPTVFGGCATAPAAEATTTMAACPQSRQTEEGYKMDTEFDKLLNKDLEQAKKAQHGEY